MRFLIPLFILAIIACKTKSSDQTADSSKADSLKAPTYKYTFEDTILVSLYARDFHAVTKSKPNMPILDIRSEAKFNSGHIWRAVSLDQNAKDFDRRLASFGRNQEYAIYCQDGRNSFKVAEEMKKMGFYRIYHLRHGVNNWGESGQALQFTR